MHRQIATVMPNRDAMPVPIECSARKPIKDARTFKLIGRYKYVKNPAEMADYREFMAT
jgi:hypothetical protein